MSDEMKNAYISGFMSAKDLNNHDAHQCYESWIRSQHIKAPTNNGGDFEDIEGLDYALEYYSTQEIVLDTTRALINTAYAFKRAQANLSQQAAEIEQKDKRIVELCDTIHNQAIKIRAYEIALEYYRNLDELAGVSNRVAMKALSNTGEK